MRHSPGHRIFWLKHKHGNSNPTSEKPYEWLHALTTSHKFLKMHHDSNTRYTHMWKTNTIAICSSKNLKQKTPNETDKQKLLQRKSTEKQSNSNHSKTATDSFCLKSYKSFQLHKIGLKYKLPATDSQIYY